MISIRLCLPYSQMLTDLHIYCPEILYLGTYMSVKEHEQPLEPTLRGTTRWHPFVPRVGETGLRWQSARCRSLALTT